MWSIWRRQRKAVDSNAEQLTKKAHPSYGAHAGKGTRPIRRAGRISRPKEVSYVGATSNLGTISYDSDDPDDLVMLKREEHIKTI